MENHRSKQFIVLNCAPFWVAWWNLATPPSVLSRVWIIPSSTASMVYTLPAHLSLSCHLSCQITVVIPLSLCSSNPPFSFSFFLNKLWYDAFFFKQTLIWCLKIKKKIFVYLATLGFGCCMWDLVLWTEIEPGPPAVGAWSLSHWTIRVSPFIFLNNGPQMQE